MHWSMSGYVAPSPEAAKEAAKALRPKHNLGVFTATSKEVGEEFGSGVAAYLLLLKILFLCSAVSACSFYVVNCIITIVASEDVRLTTLHGPQALARAVRAAGPRAHSRRV